MAAAAPGQGNPRAPASPRLQARITAPWGTFEGSGGLWTVELVRDRETKQAAGCCGRQRGGERSDDRLRQGVPRPRADRWSWGTDSDVAPPSTSATATRRPAWPFSTRRWVRPTGSWTDSNAVDRLSSVLYEGLYTAWDDGPSARRLGLDD